MIHERFIDPVTDLGSLLLEVEKPARYVGGEYGILGLAKKNECLRSVIAFPDLYEIGMGNHALKIIYNRLNNIPGILCDRAFAPAPDFEKLLREKNIPLYGLDTGISLASLDLLMFTIGYELSLGGILTMLDVSQIPLRHAERSEDHPIVIAGGPAVSNPLPYSLFVDAFWIGEAEAGFFDLAVELAQLKKRGESRAVLLEKISRHPNVFVKGKEKTRRAVAGDFSFDNTSAVFPVSGMKIVQNHGVVEIMRGCPNGCRFCHAGFWYRPMRQKSIAQIVAQANEMVTRGGWREISLSSLSSGDYCGIGELIDTLNSKFKEMNVSFQLPSLKVSGFSLSLLEKISVTRKSGLTFAVETPRDKWQAAINKEVTRDSVVSIIQEARKRGWRAAKFYFMIGLPVPESGGTEGINDEEEIVNFITDVARRTQTRFNINVVIFIPKSHTPYQWACQLDSRETVKKLDYIRAKLKPMGHKVSLADLLTSRVEGLMSRGDERAGLLFEEAWSKGSRLDAWSEYIDKEIWSEILDKNLELVDFFLSGKVDPLPWHNIDSCVTHDFLKQEQEKSNNCLRTLPCGENCGLCGVCNKEVRITENKAGIDKNMSSHSKKNDDPNTQDSQANHLVEQVNKNKEHERKSDPSIYRMLFSFTKRESAVFHGHLGLVEIFSMAFTRAGLPVLYTRGFNPLPKLEIASPLSTGITAENEIATVDFAEILPVDLFLKKLNQSLPLGIQALKAEIYLIPSGGKKHSLSSLLWGSVYAGKEKDSVDYIEASYEKSYRQNRLENDCVSLYYLKRKEVLAKNKAGGSCEWASYFDTYRYLYP